MNWPNRKILKRTILAASFVTLAGFMSACLESEGTFSQSVNSTSNISTPTSVVQSAEFSQIQPLIIQQCATCHEHSSWSSYAEQDYITNGYVVAGNLAGSSIWTQLTQNGGSMPQGSTLTTPQVTLLQSWIFAIGTTAPISNANSLANAQAAAAVLSSSCISCHDVSRVGTLGTVPEFAAPVTAFMNGGDVNTFNQFFVQNGLIAEGNAVQSWLYESLEGTGSIGTMPEGSSALGTTQQQAISTWITQLAN